MSMTGATAVEHVPAQHIRPGDLLRAGPYSWRAFEHYRVVAVERFEDGEGGFVRVTDEAGNRPGFRVGASVMRVLEKAGA